MSSEGVLSQIIESGRMAHAYIFLGPHRNRMMETAIKFSKALNCLQQKRGLNSCQTCLSCKKIDNFNHPDILHIRLEENSRQIKIEQIRTLQKEAHLKPTEAKTKVIIIHDADSMNEEASNCLLKTLEEPPKNVVIILISLNLNAFLPTIISRCQIIKFTQSKEKEEDSQTNIDFIDEFLQAQHPFSAENLEFVKRPKLEQLKTLDLLLAYFRDVLVYKFLKDGSYIINAKRVKDICERANQYTAESVLALMKEFLKSKDLLQSNVNSKLVADNIVDAILSLESLKS